jgi:hypothetical protein
VVTAVGILVLGVVDIKVHSIGVRNAVLYLPVFEMGVLMAAYETPLLRAGRFVVERSKWLLAGVVALAADPNTESTTEPTAESRSGHRHRLAARGIWRRHQTAHRAAGGASGQFDSQAGW